MENTLNTRLQERTDTISVYVRVELEREQERKREREKSVKRASERTRDMACHSAACVWSGIEFRVMM